MGSKRYVALLRGINVGGKNKVPMVDLRAAFEAEGFGDVATYIQSGNVVFSTDAPAAGVEATVEATIERRLGLTLVVAVRSRAQMRRVVADAPDGFCASPDTHHRDVMFLRKPLTPAKALGRLRLRDGVDQAWAGPGVVYFSRLSERRTQSLMSRIVGTPEYQLMTIRNWRTMTKLLEMVEA